MDFRELNAKTATEVAYLPSVRECLDSLAGSKLYTTLDLNSAYWQVPIKAQHRPKSVFFFYGDGSMGVQSHSIWNEKCAELFCQADVRRSQRTSW